MELMNLEQSLFAEISEMIEQGRRKVAAQVNSTAILTYWRVGKRVNEVVLQNKRAEYGKQIVSTLSTQLKEKYGRSYELRNLRRMMQFADEFPDAEIVSTLSTQLSWSHFIELLPLKTSEARLYYANDTAERHFGVHQLRQMISRKAFERKEIANTQISSPDTLPLDTFKDPYLFDYMGLSDEYLEADLEAAVLRELEKFILEFGKGFAFVARQKRVIIDGIDFHLDLLFYNRNLKRLVAIELKQGRFQADFKGQMELYLKWLNRYERQEGENEPIGLILCAEGNREQIELLEMDKSGILVAQYWTALPPKAEFEQKIHSLLAETRERMERRKLLNGGAGENLLDTEG
ncbi:MAG: PDDEXK nuclease domain-containing protein [Clostridiales bacterium]|jgi:predicted nuclease of restriction endonuclease-like (RecB) superfamily|nr:PDDEXK nuclease domain-containing protein [Clostridiales bacterium]